MTINEIEQGNVLIAEFDGWVLIPESENKNIPQHYERGNDWMDNESFFKYHTSWDWLHRVVDKIANFAPNDYTAAKANVCLRSISSNIEDVWQAVVEFIEWFNEQKLSK